MPVTSHSAANLSRVGSTKSKEKTSKLRSSRKYIGRTKDKKPHFWIKLTTADSNVACEACGKPFSHDGYQCNDCLIFVHSNCKDATDRFGCVKYKQENEPDISRHFSMFLPERTVDAKKYNTVRSESGASLFRHDHLSFESVGSCVDPAMLFSSAVAGDRRRSAGEFNYINSIPAQWKELDLWQSDTEPWSGGRGKTERKKLSNKEIKRQDIIHELHMTERHHCRIVVVTKYIYYNGLNSQRILTTEELDTLMPGLDDILEAHFHFLSLLKQKTTNAVVVENIHEVLLRQFAGDIAEKMIDAYVKFCSQKEASVNSYHKLMITNNAFRNFMEKLSQLPFYKGKSFPDCLLLITQRLSKYHTLVESLRKNTSDDSPEKEGIAEAEKAVKQVVTRVDLGIEKVQLKQTRDTIVSLMDNKATTIFLGNTFTKKDLSAEGRELIYAGDVFWQNARRKPIEVTMLLFSDVIVFLQRSGNNYIFSTQDKKEAVVSLRKLIVRDKAGRLGSQGIYLISAAQYHAEMYEIICKTKKQLAAWTDRIQKAVYDCPEKPEMRPVPPESLVSVMEFEHLRLLMDKARQLTESRKQLYDRQLNIYEETCDYISQLNLQHDEDRSKRHDSGSLSLPVEPKSVPTFESLSRIIELEVENQKLKQDKFLLTTELLKEKSNRSCSNLAAYSSGVEELRRLQGELDLRRKEFGQFVDNKNIELDSREKAIKEKEVGVFN
ncbi:unnamed protein product [Soboliphyme baturini]|uniref:Rho guanine nucleotide exchange factor 2 n=1 Tax=Soboliphyme baturini TaxID=241478 RepID=A0A183IUE7_9BILA|nr:unnamed protein product [Soboliphyme baturini]